MLKFGSPNPNTVSKKLGRRINFSLKHKIDSPNLVWRFINQVFQVQSFSSSPRVAWYNPISVTVSHSPTANVKYCAFTARLRHVYEHKTKQYKVPNNFLLLLTKLIFTELSWLVCWVVWIWCGRGFRNDFLILLVYRPRNVFEIVGFKESTKSTFFHHSRRDLPSLL